MATFHDENDMDYDDDPINNDQSLGFVPKQAIREKVTTNVSGRVIAHIDLDCFYVQVERYHNPSLKEKPVAVVQCRYHFTDFIRV